MNRYGLTLLKKRRTLAYGLDHGIGLHWMPDWMQKSIVFVWNKTYCAICGHDETMVGIVKNPSCVDCCTPLPWHPISEQTLKEMDEAMENMREGKRSPSVDFGKYQS